MNRASSGIVLERRRICLLATVFVLASLLLAGPALSLVMAGPTQEKGQEEPKEEKEKPKKFTNSDLKRSSSSSSSSGEEATAGEDGVPSEAADGPDAEGEAADAADGEADPWDSVGVATDSEGRGEAYWRQAMSDARGAVAAAKAKRDQLQSEMNRSRVDFTAIDDPAARAVVDTRLQELYGELAEAELAITDAEQALSDLEDDARRTGALPGWLR